MTSSSEDGEPVTFDELVDAMTPRLRPGASKEDLLASLRNATRTGGHVPGAAVPDISMGPVVTDLSGTGVRPEIMKAIAGAGSLEDVAEALTGNAARRAAGLPAPPDPFSAGALPAAGLHEMFLDFLGAGFTEDQATSILGKMLAAYGHTEQDDGRGT